MKYFIAVALSLGLLAGCSDPTKDPNPLAPDNISKTNPIQAPATAPGVGMGVQAGQRLERLADINEQMTQAANGSMTSPNPLANTNPLKITVHKSESCGCCQAWIEHLQHEGFTVEVDNNPDVVSIKDALGVPQDKRSCHTGEIDGMFVEGHVPASDIRRMIEMKQRGAAVKGIAVPGMPVGSPGMEMGDRRERYDVYSIDEQGAAKVFSTHN